MINGALKMYECPVIEATLESNGYVGIVADYHCSSSLATELRERFGVIGLTGALVNRRLKERGYVEVPYNGNDPPIRISIDEITEGSTIIEQIRFHPINNGRRGESLEVLSRLEQFLAGWVSKQVGTAQPSQPTT